LDARRVQNLLERSGAAGFWVVALPLLPALPVRPIVETAALMLLLGLRLRLSLLHHGLVDRVHPRVLQEEVADIARDRSPDAALAEEGGLGRGGLRKRRSHGNAVIAPAITNARCAIGNRCPEQARFALES